MGDPPGGFPPAASSEALTPDWSSFLRALLETLDANLNRQERDMLLRAIGARMAASSPLPPMETLAGLEASINGRLAAWRWGRVSVALDTESPALVLTHSAPPRISSSPDADHSWIAPVLISLYDAWLGSQPGAETSVRTQLLSASPRSLVLRYGA